MRYLFFDIECCDGYHICEFGYVIIDDKFNVLEKNDLIINPEEKFDLHGDRMQDRIELFYTEEEYMTGKTFDYYYDTIKTLIENDNQIVIGHSLKNDAGFLRTACRKYKKGPINFDFYDTQNIYAEFIAPGKTVSLEKAKESLNVENKGFLHKSDDDAESTMLFVKKICEHLNCSLSELINASQNCKGFSKNFNIGYVETSLPKILEYAKDNPDKISQSKKEKTFMRIASNKNYDKVVGYATEVLKHRFAEMLQIAKYIKNKGYTFTSKISECDIFIKYDEFDEEGNLKECLRLKSANLHIEEGKKIVIYDFQSFLSSIGLTEETLKDLPFPQEEDFGEEEVKNKKRRDRKLVSYIESNGEMSIGDLLKAKGLVISR